MQPPSGGCVLKLAIFAWIGVYLSAAAFGRLCVETKLRKSKTHLKFAAAFGRLCVETSTMINDIFSWFGSRLRAAVC